MLALEPWLRARRSSIDCALSDGDTRPLMLDGGASSSDAPPAGDCSVLPPPLSGESPDDAITRTEVGREARVGREMRQVAARRAVCHCSDESSVSERFTSYLLLFSLSFRAHAFHRCSVLCMPHGAARMRTAAAGPIGWQPSAAARGMHRHTPPPHRHEC